MTTHAHRAHDRHEPEGGACPTCGPTRTEQHPRREGVTRCANCKEWLTRPDSTPTEREAGDVGEVAAVRLAEESFRHSWDMSDERKIDGAWIQGLCCECGEFVPFGQEVAHLAAALAPLIAEREAKAWDEGYGAGSDDECADRRGYEPTMHANPYRAAEKPGAGL